VADGQVQTACGVIRCETSNVDIGAVQVVIGLKISTRAGWAGELAGVVARTVYLGGGSSISIWQPVPESAIVGRHTPGQRYADGDRARDACAGESVGARPEA